MATGEGLIKAAALSDTCLPQEPPQPKHIVGALPAVHYHCWWLANEGNVTPRQSIGRKSQNGPRCCAFRLTGPTGMFSTCL